MTWLDYTLHGAALLGVLAAHWRLRGRRSKLPRGHQALLVASAPPLREAERLEAEKSKNKLTGIRRHDNR